MDLTKNEISTADRLAKSLTDSVLTPIKTLPLEPATSPAQPVVTKDPSLVSAPATNQTNTSTASSIASTVEQYYNTPPLNDAELYNLENPDQMETKETTYLEINLPSNNTPATTTGSTLTEDQKKQRAIIIASILLGLIVLMIVLFTRKTA